MEIENLKLTLYVGIKCSNCGEKMDVDLLNIMEESGSSEHQCKHCGAANNLSQNKDFLDFAKNLSEKQEEFRGVFLEALDKTKAWARENKG